MTSHAIVIYIRYGPACCNCDGKQTYKPASSSGWAPLFNPSSASTAWQATLKLLTSIPHTAGGIQRVVSPAMANGATAQPGVDCSADPAVDNNPHTCQGWMAMFKNFTLKLPCQDMATGKTTNCWDAMDAINIHAYSRTAQEVKAKISGYYDVFKEDFEGLNGRTKKTLWLTEVAMASNKPAEISQFMTELLNGKDGLGNRAPASAGGFGYVWQLFPRPNPLGVPRHSPPVIRDLVQPNIVPPLFFQNLC